MKKKNKSEKEKKEASQPARPANQPRLRLTSSPARAAAPGPASRPNAQLAPARPFTSPAAAANRTPRVSHPSNRAFFLPTPVSPPNRALTSVAGTGQGGHARSMTLFPLAPRLRYRTWAVGCAAGITTTRSLSAIGALGARL